MKIYKTTNYDKFKILKGNRHISESQIKKIWKSIGEKNRLDIAPIIVNENFEIIDGQHRLEVARKYGLNLYYMIEEGADLRDVQLLNSASKSWSLQDYVNSYIELGNEDYEILNNFCQFYNISISTGTQLIGINSHDNTNIGLIKTGEFKVTRLKEGEAIADEIISFKEYTDKGVWQSNDFIRAIARIHKSKVVSHSKLIEKLKLRRVKINRLGSTKEYLRVLEEAYNYKMRNGGVRFF